LFLNARLLNVYQTTVNIKNLILTQSVSSNTDLHLQKRLFFQPNASGPEKYSRCITEGRLWFMSYELLKSDRPQKSIYSFAQLKNVSTGSQVAS
jgi:hypothetical protein